MREYKVNAARVRIHNEYDKEKLQAATEKFMKGVQKCQKQKSKTESC